MKYVVPVPPTTKGYGENKTTVPGHLLTLELVVELKDIAMWAANRLGKSKTGRTIGLGGMVKARLISKK